MSNPTATEIEIDKNTAELVAAYIAYVNEKIPLAQDYDKRCLAWIERHEARHPLPKDAYITRIGGFEEVFTERPTLGKEMTTISGEMITLYQLEFVERVPLEKNVRDKAMRMCEQIRCGKYTLNVLPRSRHLVDLSERPLESVKLLSPFDYAREFWNEKDKPTGSNSLPAAWDAQTAAIETYAYFRAPARDSGSYTS